MTFDYDNLPDPPEEAEDSEAPLLTLEDVAFTVPPGSALGETMTPHLGALIAPDGTVYVLLEQFYHGVVLALLEPELTAAAGWEPPRRRTNVYKYQRLGFRIQDQTSLLAFSNGYTGFNFTKGERACTEAQVLRALECMVSLDANGEDEVVTDGGVFTANTVEPYLRKKGRY